MKILLLVVMMSLLFVLMMSLLFVLMMSLLFVLMMSLSLLQSKAGNGLKIAVPINHILELPALLFCFNKLTFSAPLIACKGNNNFWKLRGVFLKAKTSFFLLWDQCKFDSSFR